MAASKLSKNSKRMATFCLIFIFALLILNTAVWIFPKLSSTEENRGLLGSIGLHLTLTNNLSDWGSQIADLTWWQKVFGFILSTLPLAFLIWGLYHLRALFHDYAKEDYFSTNASRHMAFFGRSVILWVIANFLCEPLLCIVTTMMRPEGERLITLSFTSSSFIALFIAGCVMVIAQILSKAKEMDCENQQFI